LLKIDTDKSLLAPNNAYKRTLAPNTANATLRVEGHCDYSLMLWYVDARATGRCFGCRGRKMEIQSYDERQCYRCGRWYSGSLVGRSQFIDEDQVNDVHEKKSNVQTYNSQQFEEQLGAPKFAGAFGEF